jgi:ABC-type lipoprotein export system ATPase subunit
VSDEYTPRLAEFLRELADKTGVQILLVTHQSVFAESADKVYRFSQRADGSTSVQSE